MLDKILEYVILPIVFLSVIFMIVYGLRAVYIEDKCLGLGYIGSKTTIDFDAYCVNDLTKQTKRL